MNHKISSYEVGFLTIFLWAFLLQEVDGFCQEQYRPNIHFSPNAHWINDPNGMVYYKGLYHLFFQYNPNASVWGPMHWGHATSKDLIRWEEHPIALYPDSLGTIFSGSAVFDEMNSSGFGTKANPPLVAIFTQHNEEGERAGKNDFQTQSIAYSIDGGFSWIKYKSNPVLKNPGIRDFRDPKVSWHASLKKWIMVLAASDRVKFYSSPDLKNWKFESDFGQNVGAHGGVWECPDLVKLDLNCKSTWVLIVNINPGGPNNGSATQYFLGHFDGTNFKTSQKEARWLDYGPDEYAGITWSNTGSRKIFMGWMSNWMYANQVPTETWRNAMTLPRELKLIQKSGRKYIGSLPVRELYQYEVDKQVFSSSHIRDSLVLKMDVNRFNIPFQMKLDIDTLREFEIVFGNSKNEVLIVGYDQLAKNYYIDRSNAGISNFHKDFASSHTCPRFVSSNRTELTVILDASSVELFADDGLSVMTSLVFPTVPFQRISIRSKNSRVNQIETNSFDIPNR